MKIKHHIITVLAVMLAAWSCIKDSTPPEATGPRHTMIMYMLGDSNLAGDLAGNVNDVIAGSTASLPANGRIFVFYDDYSAVTLYEVVKHRGVAEKVAVKSYDVPRNSAAVQVPHIPHLRLSLSNSCACC